jgi:hypothetical protein
MTALADRRPVALDFDARSAASRATYGELIAFEAIAWPAATLTLTAFLFAFGIPIGRLHLWTGLALSLAAARLNAEDWRSWLVATAWFAAIAVAASVALGWLYDFSGDGQWYHQTGVLALSAGWDPFLAWRLLDWNTGFEAQLGSAAIYVQHYAKGDWIVASAFYLATGSLEGAKLFNFLYPLATYLIAAGFLHRLGLSRIWAHAIALAAAANPAVVYQMHSFFVDGQLASLCTLLVVLSLDYFHEPRRRTLFMLGMCVLVLANLKFTGLVHAVSLGVGLSVLAWIFGHDKAAGRHIAAGIASVVFAVSMIGYQPYVTNTITHGNPFFPVLDRDQAADVAMGGQFERWAPPDFTSMNRVEKLTRSLFSESASGEEMPEWKVPFTVAKRELYIFFNTEPRYGGFGPWFGGVLALTLLGYSAAFPAMRRRVWIAGVALAVLMLASALLNREAWWARLSPQIWLVPLILIGAVALDAPRWTRTCAAILLAALLANSALIAALSWGRAAEKTSTFRTQLTELRTLSRSAPIEVTSHPSFRMVTEERLRSWSIDFRRAAAPSCLKPIAFSYPASAQARACPSGQ